MPVANTQHWNCFGTIFEHVCTAVRGNIFFLKAFFTRRFMSFVFVCVHVCPRAHVCACLCLFLNGDSFSKQEL